MFVCEKSSPSLEYEWAFKFIDVEMENYHQRHSSHSRLLLLVSLCFIQVNCVTVRVSVGGDAVLPCDVGATTDASELTVEWNTSPVQSGRQHVYFWRHGGEEPENQSPCYVSRTSVFQDEVKKGNVSLKLTRVKPSDEGIYTCYIPEINKKSTVQLTVEPLQVRAGEGEDVILSCQTNVAVPVAEATVEWSRKDLTPPFIHVIKNGQELPVEKNSVYTDRTSVSVDRSKDGDVSLTISAVQLSDEGKYTCSITSEKECVFLLTVGSPEVHVSTTKSTNPNNIMLDCLATGFISKDVTLDIRRDGRVVDHLDGLQSTGVRPNGDGTFQIKKHVEILRCDPARFSCELKHHRSNLIKVRVWDRSELDEDSGLKIRRIGVGLAVGLQLLVMGVWCLWHCVKSRKDHAEDSGPSSTAIVAAAFEVLMGFVAAGIIFKNKIKGIAGEGSRGGDCDTEMKKLNVVKVDISSNDSGVGSLEKIDEKEKLHDSSTLSIDSAHGTSGDSSPELERLLKDNEEFAENSEDEEEAMPMAPPSERIRVEDEDSGTV